MPAPIVLAAPLGLKLAAKAGGIPLSSKNISRIRIKGAGITANELKKAGQNRAIIEMYKSGN